jgi:hypothetical protein
VKPVDQEFIDDRENGQFGDCQRAVIASLLELPISEVPHFLQQTGDDNLKFWTAVQSFLALHNCVHMSFGGGFNVEFYSQTYGTPAIYHEISGPSPRGKGLWHAVVGCNGKIVHDPHPSKAGLAGDPSDWEFAVLVRLNQAAA